MKKLHLLLALLLSAATVSQALAVTYTWDGNGTPDVGGNWSVGANWNPDAVAGGPKSGGDVGLLGDVTTGTRTVIYDSATGGYLSSLSFSQTTAGAVNLLDIQKTLTVSNLFTLGATAGTAQIVVEGGNNLVSNAGMTLGANGVLVLAVNSTSGAVGNVYVGAGAAGLTIAGGTLQMAATTYVASSPTSVVNGDVTMTSGLIEIVNSGTGITADRRLTINGNTNITGGTISTTRNGSSGAIFLNGATNVFNPTTFDSDLYLTLGGNGAQSLTTNQSLSGGITLRGYGVKTVTRTGGTTINAISFLDNSNSAAQGTTLQLGSDLTLATGAVMPNVANYSNTADTNGAIQVGIDTNGHTLDLTAGAGGGVFAPNKSSQAGITTTAWTFSNSGAAGTGVIAANGFNFSSSGATTSASNVVFEARGTGLDNNLGGTGDITASIFRYNAASGSSANLISSNRAVGAIEVRSGALNIGQAALSTGGYVDITGGSFSLNGSSVGTLSMASGQNFSMTGGTITFTLGVTSDQIISAGSAGFSISDSILALVVQSGFDYSKTYLFSGFTSGAVSNLNIALTDAGGNAITDYSATLGVDGGVSFTAIPEPSVTALLISSVVALLVSVRRRNREMAAS